MGEEDEAICPYCATHFVFDATLGADCDPPECAYTLERVPDFRVLSPAISSSPLRSKLRRFRRNRRQRLIST